MYFFILKNKEFLEITKEGGERKLQTKVVTEDISKLHQVKAKKTALSQKSGYPVSFVLKVLLFLPSQTDHKMIE